MVPLGIRAVVVDKVVPLRPLHGRVLAAAEPVAVPRGGHRLTKQRRERRAPADDEPGEPRHERLVPVVRLVLAVLGGPRRRVPDRPVQPHRPQRERRAGVLPRVPPYRYVVDEEAVDGER